jgi:hypothetical protein
MADARPLKAGVTNEEYQNRRRNVSYYRRRVRILRQEIDELEGAIQALRSGETGSTGTTANIQGATHSGATGTTGSLEEEMGNVPREEREDMLETYEEMLEAKRESLPEMVARLQTAEERLEELYEPRTRGGSKRSGFIQALIAKKKAGKSFNPEANKDGRAKEGLDERFDPKKLKTISRNILQKKGTPLQKKWEQAEIDSHPPSWKPKTKAQPWPNKRIILDDLEATTFERLFDELNMKGKVNKPPASVNTQAKRRNWRTGFIIKQRTLEKIMNALKKVSPFEYERIKDRKYTMYKNPSHGVSQATLKRKVAEKPESRAKRLASARAYKARKKAEKEAEKEANPRTLEGEGRPREVVFWKGAKHAYDQVAPAKIDGFRKIADSPTLDAYLRDADKTILIASRGTNVTDPKDLSADAQLLLNRLPKTARYKKDVEVLQQIMKTYPPSEFEYYLAGHSLSGAIITQLRRDFPMLKEGVAYNPAFQTADLRQQPKGVKRLYVETDFLRNLGGKYFRDAVTIPPDPIKAKGFFDRIRQNLTPAGVRGHSLDNFKKLYPELRGSGLFHEALKFLFPQSLTAKTIRKAELHREERKKLAEAKGMYSRAGIKQEYERKRQLVDQKGARGAGKKKDQIDFGELRWGTFKDLHSRYLRKYPSSKFKTLDKFARYIVKNPKKFSERARKKAQFYINVIKQ